MFICPFCKTELDQHNSTCTTCHAERGYFRLERYVVGKRGLIFLGMILPFFIIIFGISAQNELGMGVSISMIIPIFITLWKLMIGKQWYGEVK